MNNPAYSNYIMRKFIHNVIKNSPIVKWFIKAPMPSWVVLYSDMLLTLIASFIVFYLNVDTTPGFHELWFHPWAKSISFTAIAFVFLLVMKPYRYIVRLSAFEDTYRIFSSIAITALTAFLCDGVGNQIAGYHYFGTWSIFIISFITFSFLVTTRIIIKYVYSVATHAGKSKQKVVILGSAINSYALATALKNEVDGKFDPVLLLSISPKKAENIAGTIPI